LDIKREARALRKNRLDYLIICLIALLLITLSVVGGLGGCGEKRANPWDNEQTEGNGDKDSTQADGFTGIAAIMDDQIYLASEEGTIIQQLTSSPSGYEDLAFSPSASQLAATKVEGDAMPQLLVIDVKSGKEKEVSWTNPDYSGAWTQAGVDPWFGTMSWASEKVLYCTAVESVGGEFRFSVVKYDISIPEVQVIEKDAANPALSPDGKELAYIRKPVEWEQVGVGSWGNLSPGDLVVRKLADGTTTVINVNRDGNNRGYIFDAAFSPDGEHMVVDCFDEPDTELYYTDMDGNIIFALAMTGPQGAISHPGFSPDGAYAIACSQSRSTPDGPWDYMVIIRPVTENMPEGIDVEGAMNPTWSPVEPTVWE
jgi:WD40 repeat protein